MRRAPKAIPVQMVHATPYGDAYLIVPPYVTLDDLSELEVAVRLQLGLVRRNLERCLSEDWDEALRLEAAFREAA